ncbi:RNA polymerase-associated protein RapA [Symmachiella dynata]|uniref:RNA polymerase-associated protein RapA n=1 Tax=Symmachiella dynata TaxID=2527995 RepID=A0A517ZY43_9PLAN|nr:helicase-related protein [Symmachiella dynata]QDU47375.1 RNA polymerase-associated protein RapA [Symmachiella dynata]
MGAKSLSDKLCVGSWAFSQEYRESVRILESQTIWDHTSYLVWRPNAEAVAWVTADRLSPIDEPRLQSFDNLLYRVGAARVVEGLAEDVLLAPLEAGVIPLPHQLAALSRAMSGDKVRYLFADEVGLGKTIEAGLVIRELKLRGLVKRVLVVAPKGLVTQWVQEMRTHFHEDFQLLSPSDFSAYRHLVGDDNIWHRFDQVVCPVDSVKPLEKRRGWNRERIERHNQERIGDLIAAGWDLIVIDEAHRLGGSSDTVARYKLGKALADAAPYLLLLSATPHQGKTESFHRLMSLLDQDAFPDIGSIKHENVAPFVVRTEKRNAINDRGEPLFMPRSTRLVTVKWQEKHALQEQLYEAVTEYVRQGYNQAMRDNRQYLGFLMILMQRLVTSSTRAIASALERRIGILQSTTITEDDLSDGSSDWFSEDSQEQMEELLASKIAGLHNEREEVKLLLDTAKRCQAQGPDARAEALLDLLYKTGQEENDPELKFLIFTEFVPTQQMLAELLTSHGFKTVCLNGSLDLDSRQRVQEDFSKEARILVSTDAGGEGLNLQFAHVVVNYDLPWNPMRIEQRIGRVDRIGQKHLVKAFNLIFEDSVELRVHEVLEEKLKIIYAEFGVDKTGDVLDSAESGADFERVFAKAIVNPDGIEQNVDNLMMQVRERAEDEQSGKSLYEKSSLDAKLASLYVNHPMPYWIERMTTSYLQAEGGRVEKKLFAYDLTWPDGEEMNDICFFGREAQDKGLNHVSLENSKLRALVELLPRAVAGEPIPKLTIGGLSAKIVGFWSLWQVALRSSEGNPSIGSGHVRILPLFTNNEGRTFLPTARTIWENLLQGGPKIEETGTIEGEASQAAFGQLRQEAEKHGENLFGELHTHHQENIRSEREKGRYAFHVRRQALNRIGLPEVRQFRIRKLDEEEREWTAALTRRERVFPELQPVCVLFVEASDG